MKKFLKWFGGIFVIVALIAFLVFQFYLKQKPFAKADDYWAQLENHKLTLDVVGHWNHWMGTNDIFSFGQKPIYPLPSEPYDMSMWKKWVDEHRYDKAAMDEVYGYFATDSDYGWPKELRGVVWMYFLHPWVWASPSVAIIEPGRTAEACFGLREAINMYRSPAVWKDYAFDQAWGDPTLKNVMWKGPLLIVEGLYGMMCNDKETFRTEMQAFAQDLFELQAYHMNLPEGKGYVGGVSCEPNHWFPQCNSYGTLGILLYDKLYEVDQKHGVLIGEKYKERYIRFMKEQMTNPDTGMIYRKYHPYGPQQKDKTLSGFANVFVALMVNWYEPEFARNIYNNLRERYIRSYPLDIGSYIVEIPMKDAYGQLVNPGADYAGMIGESAANVFLAWVATREFDDKKTFNELHKMLTNLARPYWRQGEIRFDETNDEPSGVGDKTIGQLLNSYSGWWLLAKTHVGWKKIMEYDWSTNWDKDGRPLNNP